MTSDGSIRRAQMRDAEALPSIERSAGEAFRQIANLAHLVEIDDLPVEWHLRIIALGESWVAVDGNDAPIGFLSAEVFDGELHIWELGVLRHCQRAGLGRQLVQRSIEDAKSRGLAAVTLTTFRYVSWNAPFYMQMGFIPLESEAIGRRLEDALREEVERGLPRDGRCAMRLVLLES